MDILTGDFQYEERFITFIDILGFKEYIIELEKSKDKEKFNKLKSALQFMQEETEESAYWDDLSTFEEKDGIYYGIELGHPKLLYISDCIIISTDADMNGFK